MRKRILENIDQWIDAMDRNSRILGWIAIVAGAAFVIAPVVHSIVTR